MEKFCTKRNKEVSIQDVNGLPGCAYGMEVECTEATCRYCMGVIARVKMYGESQARYPDYTVDNSSVSVEKGQVKVCDICSKAAYKDESYLLSTDSVLSCVPYLDFAINKWVKEGKIPSAITNGPLPSSLYTLVKEDIRKQTGNSPWLVCRNCVSMFPMEEREKSSANARAVKFWADDSTQGQIITIKPSYQHMPNSEDEISAQKKASAPIVVEDIQVKNDLDSKEKSEDTPLTSSQNQYLMIKKTIENELIEKGYRVEGREENKGGLFVGEELIRRAAFDIITKQAENGLKTSEKALRKEIDITLDLIRKAAIELRTDKLVKQKLNSVQFEQDGFRPVVFTGESVQDAIHKAKLYCCGGVLSDDIRNWWPIWDKIFNNFDFARVLDFPHECFDPSNECLKIITRGKTKSMLVKGGWSIASVEITCDAKEETVQSEGKDSDEAITNAKAKMPPNAIEFGVTILRAGCRGSVEVDAYTEGKARVSWEKNAPTNAFLENLEIIQPPTKGFLFFGRKKGTWKASWALSYIAQISFKHPAEVTVWFG